jgi:pSer/pThr/pTyr-binding forkhead associated (FHA) protein
LRWQVMTDDMPLAVITCQEVAGRISIGQGANAQIRIEDPHISRFHAELRWDAAAGIHLLSDLQSANGTYVNGRRIKGDVYLRAGSRLRFGMTELKYQWERRPAR